MSKLMNLVSGYVAILFASPQDDERNPDGRDLIASEGKGQNAKEVRRISDLLIPFPATQNALEQACAGMEFVVTAENGDVTKFSGIAAAAASKYMHAAETIRGMLRARTKSGGFKYTDEQIRKYAESFTKIAGREGIGAVPVTTEEEFDKLAQSAEGIAKLKELLKAKGAMA